MKYSVSRYGVKIEDATDSEFDNIVQKVLKDRSVLFLN